MIKAQAIIKNRGIFLDGTWEGARIQILYPMVLPSGIQQNADLNPISVGDCIIDSTGFIWKVTECVKINTEYSCSLVEQTITIPTEEFLPEVDGVKCSITTPNSQNLLAPYYHDSYVSTNVFRSAMSYNMKKYNKSSDPLQPDYKLILGANSKIYGAGYHIFIVDRNNYTWIGGYSQYGYNLYDFDYDDFELIKDTNDNVFRLKEIHRGFQSTNFPDMAVDINNRIGYSFGNNNYYGRMGIGTTSYTSPGVIYPLIGSNLYKKIMNGSDVGIALDIYNKVWVIGNGLKLGMNLGNTMYTSFIPFDSANSYIDICSGYDFCAVLSESGTIKTWGSNAYGQLGNGSLNSSITPVTVLGGYIFKKIYCHNFTIYGIDQNDYLYCWGKDDHYALEGVGITDGYTNIPIKIGDIKYSKVYPGELHCLGLGINGQVYGWGRTNNGRVGNGSAVMDGKVKVPTQCLYIPACIDIAANITTSYAIDSSYNLWAWGQNEKSFGKNYPTGDLTVPTIIRSSNGE